jgi:hypothetical protein
MKGLVSLCFLFVFLVFLGYSEAQSGLDAELMEVTEDR